jgi:hypothetical protein
MQRYCWKQMQQERQQEMLPLALRTPSPSAEKSWMAVPGAVAWHGSRGQARRGEKQFAEMSLMI